MAQDDDQPRAEVVDGIFNAPQAMVVDQVAGRADHKQIADVLVKNQFRRGPRVGTTDDDRKRVLALGRLDPPGGRRLALAHRVGHKTCIARFEPGEGGIWADRGNGIFGNRDAAGQHQETGGNESSENSSRRHDKHSLIWTFYRLSGPTSTGVGGGAMEHFTCADSHLPWKIFAVD